MKTLRVVALAMLAGLAALAPLSAQAYYRGGPHGYWHGPSVGIYYGGPYYGYGWGSPWYGYPYGYGYGYGYGGYYAAPSYLYGPPAVAYIERDQPLTTTPQVQQPQPQAAPAAPAAPAGQWWYLCSSPRGAYPNVRECPGGWERVPAIPPGQVK